MKLKARPKAFTPGEQKILDRLNGNGRGQWPSRLWSAKRAAASACGLAADDGQIAGRFEVKEVDYETGRMVVAADDSLPAFPQLIAQSMLNGDLAIACAVLRNSDD